MVIGICWKNILNAIFDIFRMIGMLAVACGAIGEIGLRLGLRIAVVLWGIWDYALIYGS